MPQVPWRWWLVVVEVEVVAVLVGGGGGRGGGGGGCGGVDGDAGGRRAGLWAGGRLTDTLYV